MRRQSLSLAAVLGGAFLVLLSWIWPLLAGRMMWDDQQAAEFQAASVALHESLHAESGTHSHGNGRPHTHQHAENSPDHSHGLAESQSRYQTARSRLVKARQTRDGLPRYLRWAGIIVGCLGAAGYFTAQRP